jgi:hypothetical protein
VVLFCRNLAAPDVTFFCKFNSQLTRSDFARTNSLACYKRFREVKCRSSKCVGDPEVIWPRHDEIGTGKSVQLNRSAKHRSMLIPTFSDPLVLNSRYKDGTTKACSIVFSVVPYRALQCDRCLVITT